MLVGQSPGKEEDDSGTCFVGPAGKQLDGALLAAGIALDSVYRTNAVKCKPPGNRAGTDLELKACNMYLAEEIARIRPTVIMALGGDALKALTGKSAVKGSRGRILDASPGLRTAAKVVVSWHPAYALHTPARKQQIMTDLVNDLKFADRLTQNENAASTSLSAHDLQMFLPGTTSAGLAKLLLPLLKVKQLSVDLEWTVPKQGKEVAWPWTRGHYLLSIAFSGYVPDGVYTASLAWYGMSDECKEVVRYFLRDKQLIYHYNIGDRLWMRAEGLPCDDILGDTMFLGWLDNESQVLKLDVMAPLYAGLPAGWKIEKNWYEPPTTIDDWIRLLHYNGTDTYATLLLHTALIAKIAAKPEPERGDLIRQYANQQLPVCKSFIKISENGLCMDKEGVYAQRIHWEKRRAEVIAQIADVMGTDVDSAVDIAGSGDKIQKYLYAAYGLQVDGTSKDDFTPLYGAYPVIKLFKEYQHINNKILNTQLVPWYDLMTEQGDSAVHSIYNIVTRTARGSASGERGSTIQQMLLFDMWGGNWMRRLVKAEPGYKLIAIDQSQVELRFIAWRAGVKRLIELYNESREADAHYATAGFLNLLEAYPPPKYSITPEWYWEHRHEWMRTVNKQQRHYVKPVNFGLAYQQEPPGLQDYARSTYGIPMTLGQAQAAYNCYHALYPEIKQAHQQVVREYRKLGYVKTMFNTYRRNISKDTEVFSTHIQGPAALMTMLVQIVLDEVLEREFHPDDVRMRGQVHDNILFTVRDSVVDQAAEIIKWHFEHPPTHLLGVPFESIPVPFRADIEVSERWGEPLEQSAA